MTVNGIDVAHYQSTAYGTSGLDFVFVKATEGTGYVNPSHAAQVAHGRAAGLVVGHYHFARPGSMSAQADYFLAHAGAKPGDVLAFDWEDTAVSGAEKDAWIRYVLGKAPGHRVILYANRDFWLHRDRTSYAGSGLWVADPSAPKGHPRVEHPWLFHQYSSASGLDRNVGNFVDRAALAAWAGATTPAAPQHKEDDMPTPQEYADAVWAHLISNPARPDADGKASMTPASSFQRSQDSHFDALRTQIAALAASVSAPSAPAPEIDYAKLAAALITALAARKEG
jgi:hypothetical protein